MIPSHPAQPYLSTHHHPNTPLPLHSLTHLAHTSRPPIQPPAHTATSAPCPRPLCPVPLSPLSVAATPLVPDHLPPASPTENSSSAQQSALNIIYQLSQISPPHAAPAKRIRSENICRKHPTIERVSRPLPKSQPCPSPSATLPHLRLWCSCVALHSTRPPFRTFGLPLLP